MSEQAKAAMLLMRDGLIDGPMASIRDMVRTGRDLRLSTATIHRGLVELAEAGRIWLHRHDAAAQLSADERAELLELDGRHYNAATLRG